jgi:hypothetical protein
MARGAGDLGYGANLARCRLVIHRSAGAKDAGAARVVVTKHTDAFWAATAAVTIASLGLRMNGATPDVSWLTSMCERMLDGEKGWVDIFETTPPVPTLLYMPGALLSRLAGVGSEAAVFATAYAAALCALACALRLLPDRIAGSVPSRWAVGLPAAVFLFILSNDVFAQREYFAAAFTLPMFAVFVRRIENGEWPSRRGRLCAATLAGFAFAIKPPVFALPFVAIALFELTRTRSLAFLFPSMLPVAAGTGLALTAASLAAFPAYLDGVTTLMRDIYVPIQLAPYQAVLRERGFVGTAVCIVLAVLALVRREPPRAGALAMSVAGGYVAAYFTQRKFFAYQIYPATLFVIVALTVLLWTRGAELVARARREAGIVAVYAVCATLLMAFLMRAFDDERAEMRDLSWADQLIEPTALAISPDVATSFPLAQHIGARWVDRIHSQWVARYTRVALRRGGLSETDEKRYRSYFDRDIERTVRVIHDKRPELIIQHAGTSARWLTDAMLATDPTLLDDYETIAEEGVIRILRRDDKNDQAGYSPASEVTIAPRPAAHRHQSSYAPASVRPG